MPADTLDGQHETLRRLAEVLDISPDVFFDAGVSDLSQTVELLCMWEEITDRHDRAKVLVMLKSIMRAFASRA